MAFLQTAVHSGECCGMSVLFQFPFIDNNYSLAQQIDLIQEAIDDRVKLNINHYNLNSGHNLTPQNARHCIEVVLIDEQVDEWVDALYTMGFEKVFSFLNTNSNNICYVFMLETNKGVER